MSFPLPPYIYQMIDHLYISDMRGFMYHDFFDIIINTTGLQDGNESGTLVITTLTPKTKQIIIHVKPVTSVHLVADLCAELMTAVQSHKKVLLYSDSYEASAILFYTYLTVHYHFTNEDVSRMILTRPCAPGLVQAFQSLFIKNNKNK